MDVSSARMPSRCGGTVKEHARLACKSSEVEVWLARASELDWSNLHAGRVCRTPRRSCRARNLMPSSIGKPLHSIPSFGRRSPADRARARARARFPNFGIWINIRRHQSRIALSAARIESECMTSCSKGWLLARSSSTSIPSPG